MVIDYRDLSNKITDKIESYTSSSFKHVNRYEWLDAEGNFPQGRVGNTFSTFIDNADDDEELINEDDSLLNVNIQFALDGRHDNYLNKLGYCVDAVLTLQNVSGSNIQVAKVRPYFTCETLGDFVRVEFDAVNFTVNNR